MSKDSLAMMPWFPRDFIAATLGWRLLERALYRALLDAQWELGTLPEDDDELARIAGATPEEFAAAWPRVKAKFLPHGDGRLSNRKLEEHREDALARKARKIEAGRIGGKASVKARAKQSSGGRSTAASTAASTVAQANGQANFKPPSPSPSPSTLREEKTPPREEIAPRLKVTTGGGA